MERIPEYDEDIRILADLLVARGAVLATAESCTGGLIATLCTSRAGSSQWFDRAFVTYSNAAKFEMLGVPHTTIAQHGAVSEAVVHTMARGAVARSGATAAVSVSGVAGPDGGSSEKPVGTVWIGYLVASDTPGSSRIDAQLHRFDGDRAAVRFGAASAAIRGLIARLKNTG